MNYVYLVSHWLSYEEQDLQKDNKVKDYNIIRINYKDNFYFQFLLTLLRTSKYSLFIHDGCFIKEYPDELWIQKAIQTLNTNSDRDIVTCSIEKDDNKRIFPYGCMFLSSLRLRYIITKTRFRVNEKHPYIYFYQSFKCLFNSTLIAIPYEGILYNNLQQYRKSIYNSTDYEKDCVNALNIKMINCEDHYSENDNSIGIVISQFKREYLTEQIEAINKSTLPPSEIIIYQNLNFYNYKDIFIKHPSLYHIWSTNWQSPFFIRNLVPLLFRTHYHILFDDDIIPGIDTIIELVNAVKKYKAPSGVDGRIVNKSFFNGNEYCFIGVASNNNIKEVDYVIQVYIRNEIQSKVFWRYRPYTHRNGEDIHGGLSWYMECKTRPHRVPYINTAKYKNYGNDNVATYKTNSHSYLRSIIFRSWIIGGYKPVLNNIDLKEYPTGNDNLRERYLNKTFRYF